MLFANDKSPILGKCQAELVEADVLIETFLRQAQADIKSIIIIQSEK